jgi:hypothetical protein
MANHTPGPWKVKGTEVWAAHKRITMGRGAYDEKDRAIRGANAKLIAAAPDLLDALKSIMTADMIAKSGVPADEHTMTMQDALDFARPAIDKAA